MNLRHAAGCALALCALPAFADRPRHAPALDPALAAAFNRLDADLEELSAEERGETLGAHSRDARREAERRRFCKAVQEIGVLRASARHIDRHFTARDAATVDADALGVDAVLLTEPGTAACGGSTVPPSATLTTGVVASDPTQLVLHVTFPPPRFVPREGGGAQFTEIFMDGLADRGAGHTGEPSVPVTTPHYAVPIGARPSVTVVGSTSYLLPAVRPWPVQRQALDGAFDDPPFVIDSKLYASRLTFPAQPSAAGAPSTWRDFRVAGVELSGAQWSAATGALRVYTSLDVKIDFAGENSKLFGDERASSVWNLASLSLYRSSLVNAETAISNVGALGHLILCGEEVLIVTSAALRPAADKLAAAKIAQGLSTRVLETGSAAGEIGTTTAAIQTAIRNELNTGCFVRPQYLILLGNTANVPTFRLAVPGYGNTEDNLIATDLPYALKNDDGHLNADAAYGRIPAFDLTSANAVVDKILSYENSPPFNPTMFSNATIASYFQGGGPNDARTFTQLSELVRSSLIAKGYTVNRIYTDDGAGTDDRNFVDGTALPSALLRSNGFTWSGSTADIQSAFNAGKFLILHRDHGAPGGWGSPSFGTGDLAALHNGANLPVVFSVNCASGKYDDASPNWAEQLLQLTGGGAAGIVGDSRDSPSWANSHLARGMFDAIFPNVMPAYGSATPITRMGDVLASAKLYLDTQDGIDGQAATDTTVEHYLYTYFGDPTMQIWTHQPPVFHLSAVALQAVEAGLLLTLAQAGTDGAAATLLRGGVPVGRGIVINGQALIPIPPQPPPTAEIAPAPLTLSLDRGGFVAALVPLNAPR